MKTTHSPRGQAFHSAGRYLRPLCLLLLLLAVTLQGQPAMAAEAVTAQLQAVGGSGVTGSAILTADGGATSIALKVSGLAPGASAQAGLHAGTCAQPSASFASLPGLAADSSGQATATGRVLFRGTDDVALQAVADGEHIIAISLPGRVVACGLVPPLAAGDIDAALLVDGERQQVIQFNPGAALQKRIFADGFVPNSAEFSLDVEGTSFAVQRAEQLRSGAVRVYYARSGNWSNVGFYQRGAAGDPPGKALLAEAEHMQLIRLNPGAALQRRILDDGFVPNSDEFSTRIAGGSYVAQRAEHLSTGRVRVYYAATGNWGEVRFAQRGGANTDPRWNTYTSQHYAYAVSYPADWHAVDQYNTQAGPAVRGLERVTLQQPGYGRPGKFTFIDIAVAKGGWPTTGLDCTSNTTVAGLAACRLHLPAGQNPAQDLVKFQRGDAYYEVRIVLADDQTAQLQLNQFQEILSSLRFAD